MKGTSGRYFLAALAVLLTVVVAFGGGYATWRGTLAAARRDLSDRADLARENAARFSETALLILNEVSHILAGRDDASLARDEASLHGDLARLATGLSQVRNILVWGRDGGVLAAASLFPVGRSNDADRDYFIALAAGARDPWISNVMVGRLNKMPFFNVTLARRDAGGGFAGVVGVALDPDTLEQRYLQSGLADMGGGVGIAMLRADGVVLVRAPGALGPRGEAWPGFVEAVRRSSDAGRTDGPPGRDTWATEYRLVPGLPLYVVATMTTSELRRRWWDAFRGEIWFGASAALLLLALVAQLIRGAGAAARLAAEAARRAEQLAGSEARARALFLNSPDVRTIVQARPDGRFTFLDVNDAVLRTFPWSRETIVGKAPHDFYPAAMADEAVARMRECLRLGQPVTYEARRVAAGELRIFETTMVPVNDPDGKQPTMIVTNARDITERRKIEAHLREAQKLETLSQLAGGLAHDFNNILVIVAGQLERLQVWLDRHAPDAQPLRYLRHASAGLERGGALVRRMLTFARRQEARPEALDLAALIANLADFVRVTVGAGVDVVIEPPPQDGRVLSIRADATQIELAVVNLALNARDAMRGQGRITIAVAERAVAADEPDLPAGSYAVLEVRDEGEGMDEATLARATEPFFTTKAAGKGTGLGLAMVRGLAVQTGGAVRLRSQVGHGTTVALWFPLADDADASSANLESSDQTI